DALGAQLLVGGASRVLRGDDALLRGLEVPRGVADVEDDGLLEPPQPRLRATQLELGAVDGPPRAGVGNRNREARACGIARRIVVVVERVSVVALRGVRERARGAERRRTTRRRRGEAADVEVGILVTGEAVLSVREDPIEGRQSLVPREGELDLLALDL